MKTIPARVSRFRQRLLGVRWPFGVLFLGAVAMAASTPAGARTQADASSLVEVPSTAAPVPPSGDSPDSSVSVMPAPMDAQTLRGVTASRGGIGRWVLAAPRALLFPARVATRLITLPAAAVAGQLAPWAPFDRIAAGIEQDRYFLPLIAVDPEFGMNAGVRAAHRSPLPGGGVVSYRAAYGGTHAQVLALTLRSRDPRMIPYRTGWAARVTAKYENTHRHPYFGRGNESSSDSLTYYNQERFLLLGKVSYAAHPWLRGDLSLSKHRTQIGRATELDPGERSLEEYFPMSVSAPGPHVDPEKLWVELALTLDTRDERGRPAQGIFAEGFYGQARGSGDDPVGFERYGFELQAYVRLGRGHVLVARVAGEEVSHADADTLHFTELLGLGGRSTLRGYRDNRFLGEATILLTGEYRARFAPCGEICLFGDFGEAVPALTDPTSPLRMNWEGLHRSFGAGLRFATRRDFWLRGHVAFSEEGTLLCVTLESAFDREDRRERR